MENKIEEVLKEELDNFYSDCKTCVEKMYEAFNKVPPTLMILVKDTISSDYSSIMVPIPLEYGMSDEGKLAIKNTLPHIFSTILTEKLSLPLATALITESYMRKGIATELDKAQEEGKEVEYMNNLESKEVITIYVDSEKEQKLFIFDIISNPDKIKINAEGDMVSDVSIEFDEKTTNEVNEGKANIGEFFDRLHRDAVVEMYAKFKDLE